MSVHPTDRLIERENILLPWFLFSDPHAGINPFLFSAYELGVSVLFGEGEIPYLDIAKRPPLAKTPIPPTNAPVLSACLKENNVLKSFAGTGDQKAALEKFSDLMERHQGAYSQSTHAGYERACSVLLRDEDIDALTAMWAAFPETDARPALAAAFFVKHQSSVDGLLHDTAVSNLQWIERNGDSIARAYLRLQMTPHLSAHDADVFASEVRWGELDGLYPTPLPMMRTVLTRARDPQFDRRAWISKAFQKCGSRIEVRDSKTLRDNGLRIVTSTRRLAHGSWAREMISDLELWRMLRRGTSTTATHKGGLTLVHARD